MPGIYARMTKITNAVGRSNYITDSQRQEEIVLHKKNMIYSWLQHSAFEKSNQKSSVANNEALEIHLALPNNLYEDKNKLEQVCDDLAFEIVGENKDYEYAVHWNHDRTNLHIHILFSERENQLELEPKIYKKDIWQDKDSHKLAKANSVNAILVHKKGDIQKDKDGNIKYQTDIFKTKDKKFSELSWIHKKNRILERVFKSYGYDLIYRDKTSPYIAQKKLYKGARQDYLEKAKSWNTQVKQYNQSIEQHIELEPNQKENYLAIKKAVLKNVKQECTSEKMITDSSIELVRQVAQWANQTLLQLKVFIKSKAREFTAIEKWQQVKDKFNSLFEEHHQTTIQTNHLQQELENHKLAQQQLTENIATKKQLIQEIEDYQKKEDYEFQR